jgi:hypothetical protein
MTYMSSKSYMSQIGFQTAQILAATLCALALTLVVQSARAQGGLAVVVQSARLLAVGVSD